jgi:hypothetical protein
MLRIFERRILRRIYGTIKKSGRWISMYNRELHKLCNKPYIVRVVEVGWLRWLGQLFIMQE